jgi:hypothetical protein
MKLFVIGLIVVGALFAVSAGVGLRNDDDAAGDPAQSRLELIEGIFPPRLLRADDARKGGAPCVDGNGFTLGRNTTCAFVVDGDVQRFAVRRVARSGQVIVELTPPSGLRQRIDTGVAGPDAADPDAYRLAVVDRPSTVTIRCEGRQPCRLELDR